MKKLFLTLTVPLYLASISCNSDDDNIVSIDITPVLSQTITGIEGPESVLLNTNDNLLYVSNQAGSTDGDGYISILDQSGTVINQKWATNLNDPKGMVIYNNKMYVGDTNGLVEISMTDGSILQIYGEGQNLNDVAIDNDGNIYVSNMFTSAIYQLDTNGNFSEWLSGNEIQNPNGILIDGNTMYLAPWGTFTGNDFTSAPPAPILKVDMNTKAISQLSKASLGNLDGIQFNSTKTILIVSDWISGKIYQVSLSDGSSKEILDVKNASQTFGGSGDILVNGSKLYIPMYLDNSILEYNI